MRRSLLLLTLFSIPLLASAAPMPEQRGVITERSNGSMQLLIGRSDATVQQSRNGQRIIEVFTVPKDVLLKSKTFRTREALEQYLLQAYVAPIIPSPLPATTEPAAPPSCEVREPTFNGPPRIFILLPTSGPALMPIGIGGSNFAQGAITYVNSTPSELIFVTNIQNIPLIGSIAVGVTIVPPSAPKGQGSIVVEYNCQRSNPFPFTKTN